jgi:hypothetical protein
VRTYFWISLFTSYRITANQLTESNVILIANKEFRKIRTEPLKPSLKDKHVDGSIT